jgi:hypothetical protein
MEIKTTSTETTTETTTPTETTAMGGTATTTPDVKDTSATGKWYEGVDQDILTDPTLTPFIQEDGEISKDLLKSYVHAQRSMGKKRLAVPDKNTTPEEYRQLLTELGLPKDVSEYKITAPEGLEGDELTEFTQKAFELGIMPDQASKLVEWQQSKLQEHQAIMQNEAMKASEDVQAQLEQEWGPKMKENMEKAKMALHTFAGENTENIVNSELGNNIEFIKLMYKVSESLAEDKFDRDSVPSHYLDKTAAQRKLNEIQSDFNGPYYNKFHPAHESTVKEANELFQIIG